MNILYFIRLIIRHKILLVLSPLLIMATVFYFTREFPKKFISKTTVYTGIGTGSSIVSLEEARFDMFGSRAAFDNLIHIIKSQSTAEEVSLRLLASHLIQSRASAEIISDDSYNRLMQITPPEVKSLVVNGDPQATYERLADLKNSNYSNFVYELLHYNHPHYSIKKILDNLKVTRIQSSDLIEISYSADDPGICFNTLKLINDVFIKSYSLMKINQSDAVVRYFQGQLDNSKNSLDNAENELLEFNKSNTIINYYEQTKHISSEKEHFDLEYLDIKMKHAASESVLKVLENKLSGRQKTQLNSMDITRKRNELADIHLQIAMKTYQTQIDSVNEERQIEDISRLQLKAYNIQEELKNLITQQYYMDNTTDGITSQSVIQQWLEKVIEFESSRAELQVAKQRSLEFHEIFQKYAPLGATMKRLERKIDVAEREYLSILHSLGLAKLKQQNIELNSNIKISEPPYFPIKAEPGKRKYLLIIAFLTGLIVPLFFIIALEFLDSNIKSIQRAEQFSGLTIAGVFPNFNNKNPANNTDEIISRATDRIVQKVLFEYDKTRESNLHCQIALISHQQGEGKSTIGFPVIKKLSALGYTCRYISVHKMDPVDGIAFRRFDAENNLTGIYSAQELANQEDDHQKNTPVFTMIEIPALLNNILPASLIRSANQIYMVIRANRPWNISDKRMLKDIQSVSPENSPKMLLNGVDMDEMEKVLGDLPAKRSPVRRKIKNMAKFHFFSRMSFGTGDHNRKKSQIGHLFWLILIPVTGLLFFMVAGSFRIHGKITDQTSFPEGSIPNVSIHSVNVSEYISYPVDPAEKRDETISMQNKPDTLNYFLIGGSFQKKSNAGAYVERLKGWGFQPQLIDRNNQWFTVAIGSYSSMVDAENARANYQKLDPGNNVWILDGNIAAN